MSIVWHAVAVVLLLELLLLSFFVLPFPWGVRKNLARTLLRPKIRSAIDTVLRYVGVGLVFAIAESVNSLARLNARFEEVKLANASSGMDLSASNAMSMHDFKYRRAVGQRNLYLAAFSLVIALVLTRLVDLTSTENALRGKIKEANGGKPIDQQGNVILDKKSK